MRKNLKFLDSVNRSVKQIFKTHFYSVQQLTVSLQHPSLQQLLLHSPVLQPSLQQPSAQQVCLQQLSTIFVCSVMIDPHFFYNSIIIIYKCNKYTFKNIHPLKLTRINIFALIDCYTSKHSKEWNYFRN